MSDNLLVGQDPWQRFQVMKSLENEKRPIVKKSGRRIFEVGKSGEFQISSPTNEFLVVAMKGLGRVLPRERVELLDLIMEETKKKGKTQY
jgi:hypothetical protein